MIMQTLEASPRVTIVRVRADCVERVHGHTRSVQNSVIECVYRAMHTFQVHRLSSWIRYFSECEHSQSINLESIRG